MTASAPCGPNSPPTRWSRPREPSALPAARRIILLMTDNADLNDIALSYVTHVAIVQRDLLAPNVTQDVPGIARDVVQLRDRIIAEANASNVSVYVIDPE